MVAEERPLDLSVVVPVYNERDNLDPLVQELLETLGRRRRPHRDASRGVTTS